MTIQARNSNYKNHHFVRRIRVAILSGVLALAFGAAATTTTAQTTTPTIGQWTWEAGSDAATYNNTTVYGKLGVATAGNTPGGRIYTSSNWVDSKGNLWLFGGFSAEADFQNDLWEFTPSTNEWTWMGGTATVPNTPYGSYANGVYGTLGKPAATNIPGQREAFCTWMDHSGNFWLFGGYGVDATENLGYLNDLWEYSPTTNEWAWMGGSTSVNSSGVYGTLGTAAAANTPGGRGELSSATDANGNLWLFGGGGYDSAGNASNLNDLWMFNTTTDEWTWEGGSSTITGYGGNPGVYGTLGTPAAANTPSGRMGAAIWFDSKGHLWLFGGGRWDTKNNYELNDLWEFDPSINEWAWRNGSDTLSANCTIGQNIYCGQSGIYGTLGTPANSNYPGGRSYPGYGTDGNGIFWLFGGDGFDSKGNYGLLNDLWQFNAATGEWTWMSGISTIPLDSSANVYGQSGNYGTLGVAGAANTPGSRDYVANWIDGSGNLWIYSGFGFAASAGGYNDYLGDLWMYQQPAPAVLTSPAPKSTLTGASTTFTWSKGISVASYELRLGTTGAGSSDLYDSGATTATTEKVTNLPTNGATIYATLSSEIAGVWQDTAYTYTAPTPTPAAITSPTPSSTLTGSTATFAWSSGVAVTSYKLILGTTGTGSSDLYNSYTTTATTATVTKLPISGKTIYATLYSQIKGVWQSAAYTYTAPSPTAATITSPTPSSTLTASTVTFTWSKGLAVTNYKLILGTIGAGSSDLFNSYTTTATTATVTKLPINGKTIYATLYSQINGVWQSAAYTYSTLVPVPAALTSPTPSSTLTGSTVMFTWSKGVAVTSYKLILGSTGAGSSDLFNSYTTTATTATVTKLPINGKTIYATLYSQINGAWQSTACTYTAQ